MTRAVIFDLDGTLWDASETVTESFNLALSRLGLDRRISLDEMTGAMGKTLEEIAHIYFDCIDPTKAVGIMRYCTAYENIYVEAHGGRLYEGLSETLSELRRRGIFTAVVSNCQSGYIEAFMKYHGTEGLFDDKECWGDTGLLKADNISLVVKRNGFLPSECIYVGDTMGDYEAATAAGTRFVHSSYGYGSVPKNTPAISLIPELLDMV